MVLLPRPAHPAGFPPSPSADPRSPAGGRFSRRALVGGAAGAALAPVAARARAVEVRTIERQLLALPLRDKVAQLFVFEARGTVMTDEYRKRLERSRSGGVHFVGTNIERIEDVAPFIAAIKATNPDLPPLVTVDQEGGRVTRVPHDPAPSQPELAALDARAVRNAAQRRAEYLLGFGFDVNWSPVADVAYAPDSIMAARSFGPDPARVAERVADVVRGTRRTAIVTAVKHFPGHGRTSLDSHYGLPEVDLSLEEWRATDAVPFRAAIEGRVDCVMLGHLLFPRWDREPTTFSKKVMRVLRKDLGFGGVIATDDLGMDALNRWEPTEVLDRCLEAGVDLFVYVRPTRSDEEYIGHLVRRVEKGSLPEARIDESLRRVARLRAR